MRKILLLAVLILIGCDGGNRKLVGTWQSNAGGALSTYHFFPDGAFTMETHFGAIVATTEGKFEVDGDRLVLNPTNADAQGADRQMADQVRPTLMQPSRVPLRWNNPTSITFDIKDNGPILTLVRISEKP